MTPIHTRGKGEGVWPPGSATRAETKTQESLEAKAHRPVTPHSRRTPFPGGASGLKVASLPPEDEYTIMAPVHALEGQDVEVVNVDYETTV